MIGRGASIYSPVDGKCVGVWDPYWPLEFGSCTSKHGIYWQQHFTNKAHTEFELYDTYTKQYMVVSGGKVSQNEWIEDKPLHSDEYYNWGEYTPA